MTWMMSNVVAKADAKDNVYPRKEREQNKIDGPVALMMAMGRAMVEEPEERSIYEDAEAYRATFGDDAVSAEAVNDTSSAEWDAAILADMRHPMFAEHKRRFEAWQDMQPEEV